MRQNACCACSSGIPEPRHSLGGQRWSPGRSNRLPVPRLQALIPKPPPGAHNGGLEQGQMAFDQDATMVRGRVQGSWRESPTPCGPICCTAARGPHASTQPEAMRLAQAPGGDTQLWPRLMPPACTMPLLLLPTGLPATQSPNHRSVAAAQPLGVQPHGAPADLELKSPYPAWIWEGLSGMG